MGTFLIEELGIEVDIDGVEDEKAAERFISENFDAISAQAKQVETVDVAEQVGVLPETIEKVRDVERGGELFAQEKVKELTSKIPPFLRAEPFQQPATVREVGRGATGSFPAPTLSQETAQAEAAFQTAKAEQPEVTGLESAALGFATFPFAKTAATKISALMSDKPFDEAVVEEGNKIKEIFEIAETQHPKLFTAGEITSDIAEFVLISKVVKAYGVGTGSIQALSDAGKLTKIGRASKLFNEGFLFGSINKTSEQLDEGDLDGLGIVSNGIKDGLAFVLFEAAGSKVIDVAKKRVLKPLARKVRGWADKRRIKFGTEEAERLNDGLDMATELLGKEAAAEGKLISDLSSEEAVSILSKQKKQIIDAILAEGRIPEPAAKELSFIRRQMMNEEVQVRSILNEQKRLNAPENFIESATEQAIKLSDDAVAGSTKPGATELLHDFSRKQKFDFQQKLNAARKELNRLQKEAGLKKDFAVNIRLDAFADEAQYSLINESIKFHENLLRIKQPKIIFKKIREMSKKGTGLKNLNLLLDLDKQKIIGSLDEVRVTMDANSRRRTQLIADGLQGSQEFKNLTQSQNYLMQTTVKMGDFAGSLLRSLREDVPGMKTALKGKSYRAWRGEILKSAESLNKDIGKIKDEMGKIDLDDPVQTAELYEKFVAPKIKDLITEYRYINMLSSPKTHLINTVSNMIQTFALSPTTKIATAAVDVPFSFVTRSQRRYYFGEAPVYMMNMVQGSGKAFKAAGQAWKGRTNMRADLAGINIRRSSRSFGNLRKNFGLKSAVVGKIQNSWVWDKAKFPIKALEASDAFFRTLAQSGELASLGYRNRYLPASLKFKPKKVGIGIGEEAITRTITVEEQLAKKAEESGLYYIFRQGLRPEGQGYALNIIDDVTALLMKTRETPYIGRPLSWIVPFVQTPVNIFKQGIEYSTAGLLTVPGAQATQEQLGKAMIGSLVTASAGLIFGSQNRLIWEAPKNPKERNAFYAANLKPYSVLIGNTNVQFKYLGPLAYPLMLAAAAQHHKNESIAKFKDPATMEIQEGKLIKTYGAMIPKLAGSMLGFLGELPYAQSFGLLIDFAQGEETAKNKFGANFVRQVTPLIGTISWLNRSFGDEFVRRPEKLTDFIKASLPWPAAFQDVPTFERVLPSGERLPAEQADPEFNAFTVLNRAQIDQAQYDRFIQMREERWFGAAKKQADKEQKRLENIDRARIIRSLGGVR